MRHVDALSRYPVMVVRTESTLAKIEREQANDEDLQPIFELLKRESTYNNYYIQAKVLYKLVNDCELIAVPETLQYEIVKRAHEKGHFGVKKTRELLSKDVCIPKLDQKIQRVVANCIECILVNRKKGRQDGELHPMPKYDVPLHTYHVDHVGPLESTQKMYKYIFVVIDTFTKFCWLYPTKSTTCKGVIAKLQMQSVIFGNPQVIISDRGTAFTADDFQVYCQTEGIQHHTITTGLSRANGQAERLISTIIAVLAKLSIEEPNKWYKFVGQVQQVLNSTFHRSINTTPFEVMVGKPMRNKGDLSIKQIVEEELRSAYDRMREELRQGAKQQILRVQKENRQSYNVKRKAVTTYMVGELVAIKRTQFGGGLKLKAKYLGPYRVTAAKYNDTFDVVKIGDTEGPRNTTTCAEYMKKWAVEDPFGTKE